MFPTSRFYLALPNKAGFDYFAPFRYCSTGMSLLWGEKSAENVTILAGCFGAGDGFAFTTQMGNINGGVRVFSMNTQTAHIQLNIIGLAVGVLLSNK